LAPVEAQCLLSIVAAIVIVIVIVIVILRRLYKLAGCEAVIIPKSVIAFVTAEVHQIDENDEEKRKKRNCHIIHFSRLIGSSSTY